MPEECCGAARGTTMITTRALPTATGTIQRMPTTTLAFAVPDYFQSYLQPEYGMFKDVPRVLWM